MNDKVFVITGSAQGIGLACAEAALQKKAKVCISDFNEEKGKETECELKKKYGDSNVFFVRCDVRKLDELQDLFKKAFDHFKGLHVLINNAGLGREDNFDDVLQVNLISVIQGTEFAMKYMSKHHGHQGGVIVNVGSLAGLIPFKLMPAYTATKHGVIGYTRALGMVSEKYHGVRVNAVCPTFVDTNLAKTIVRGSIMGPMTDEEALGIIQQTAMENGGPVMLSTQDVAAKILEMAGEARGSGQVMVVSQMGCGLTETMPTKLSDVFSQWVPQQTQM